MAAVPQVDDAFAAEVRTADPMEGPLVLELAGVQVRVVENPPAGALVMFARRVDDKSVPRKVSASVRLLEKWVEPEDHEKLWDAIENLQDVESFLEGDVARFVEAVSSRPTSAPSS